MVRMKGPVSAGQQTWQGYENRVAVSRGLGGWNGQQSQRPTMSDFKGLCLTDVEQIVLYAPAWGFSDPSLIKKVRIEWLSTDVIRAE